MDFSNLLEGELSNFREFIVKFSQFISRYELFINNVTNPIFIGAQQMKTKKPQARLVNSYVSANNTPVVISLADRSLISREEESEKKKGN